MNIVHSTTYTRSAKILVKKAHAKSTKKATNSVWGLGFN